MDSNQSILAFFDLPTYVHRSAQTSPPLAPKTLNSSLDSNHIHPLSNDVANQSLQTRFEMLSDEKSHDPRRIGSRASHAGISVNLPTGGFPPSAPLLPSVSTLSSLDASLLKTFPLRPPMKPKPYISESSRRAPSSHNSNRLPPSYVPIAPPIAKSVTLSAPIVQLTNRTVSLPTQLVDVTERPQPKAAFPGQRIVSLPEPTSFPNKLSIMEHLATENDSTLDDSSRPLIDLHSPESKGLLQASNVRSSPSGSILIHSSFSSMTPSPPSSPENSHSDSESIIFIQNSPLGQTSSFLRRPPSPRSQAQNDPSPAEVRLAKLAVQSDDQDTWLKTSAPKPIPALHGPSSLPYARCPSGAEGIIISEQASLPRMIWGLDDPRSKATRPPQTPYLPNSSHSDTSPLNGYDASRETAMFTPALTERSTPASTLVGTPFPTPYKRNSPIETYNKSTRKIGPISAIGEQERGFSGTGGANDHSFSVAPLKEQKNVLGSPLELREPITMATPGGYTEYRYVDQPQWQEFIPQARKDLTVRPKQEPLFSPTIRHQKRNDGSFNTGRLVTRPLSSISHTPESFKQAQISPEFSLYSSPRIPTRPLQSKPKLRDLPRVTELLSNPELFTTASPEIWSTSLHQFWNNTFTQLSPNLPVVAALPAPAFPPGLPIPSNAANLSNVATPSVTSSTSSPSNSTEPYTGALDHPRSVPIARLRRKLATVAENKELESLESSSGHAPAVRDELTSRRTHILPLSLEAETQRAFGGAVEEGLRVRLPRKTENSGDGEAHGPGPTRETSQGSADTVDPRKRSGWSRTDSYSRYNANRKHRSDRTKENQPSLDNSTSPKSASSRSSRRKPRNSAPAPTVAAH